ncbi:MAG: type II toxin-antitoxin system Y4mF family antitoxin [Candidatus Kryptoniota bacterium]
MSKYAEIAEAVRVHRKEAGLSQKQLADLAGVGKTAVFDIEKGKESVRLDTLVKVLDALNIRMNLDGPMMRRENEKG